MLCSGVAAVLILSTAALSASQATANDGSDDEATTLAPGTHMPTALSHHWSSVSPPLSTRGDYAAPSSRHTGPGWLDVHPADQECPVCLASHLEWAQAIIPHCGARSASGCSSESCEDLGCPAGGGYNVTMALYFEVKAVADPPNNITACAAGDWRFVATWPAIPIELDSRCTLIGSGVNQIHCTFGRLEVGDLLSLNTTLYIGEGLPRHAVLGFTWYGFDYSVLPSPQPSALRCGIDATGGINLGLPDLADPAVTPPPNPPAGFKNTVMMSPKGAISDYIDHTAGSVFWLNLTVSVPATSVLAAKDAMVVITLFWDATV